MVALGEINKILWSTRCYQNSEGVLAATCVYTCDNNNNNWNLYSAFSIHKMFKSAAHCHSLSHSQQRLNGRA